MITTSQLLQHWSDYFRQNEPRAERFGQYVINPISGSSEPRPEIFYQRDNVVALEMLLQLCSDSNG
jgi:hypothetical protein